MLRSVLRSWMNSEEKKLLPKPSLNEDRNILKGLVDLVYDCYIRIPHLKMIVTMAFIVMVISTIVVGYSMYRVANSIQVLDERTNKMNELITEQQMMFRSMIDMHVIDNRSVWTSMSRGYITEGDATYIRDVVLSRVWADTNAIRSSQKLPPVSYDDVTKAWEHIVAQLSDSWQPIKIPNRYGVMRVKYDVTLREIGIYDASELTNNKKNVRAGCVIWMRYIAGSSGDLIQGTTRYLEYASVR